MKREDIERAAFWYANDNQVDFGLGGELKKGFIAGAEWRINSVWHDATETPPHNAHVLVRFRSGSMTTWYANNDIRRTFEKFDAIAWAYVKDLLPIKEG